MHNIFTCRSTFRLPDEKCAEDQHQLIRDATRNQRQSKIAASTIMRRAIEAGIPRKRGETSVRLNDVDISSATRYDNTQRPARHRWFARPKTVPDRLVHITHPRRTWPSPVAATYLQRTSAWQWLLEYSVNTALARCGTQVNDAWRSRLVSAKSLVEDEGRMFLVMASWWWGFLACSAVRCLGGVTDGV